MFRPTHPRVMNYRPRNYIPPNVHWSQNRAPRAFNGKNNCYRPRSPQLFDKNNQEHWCETCDRGFSTVKHLEDHKLQHQKCNIDGCQFVAHPKVITRHIQMQHSSGLYKKIAKLDNPEEVKKWREERKKNFPTRSNIEKKTAEMKEKIDRGEKMGLKREHRSRDSKTGNKRKIDANSKNCNDRDLKKRKSLSETKITEITKKPVSLKNTLKYLPPVDDTQKLVAFNGIQELVMNMQADEVAEESNGDLLIEDDENEQNVEDPHKSAEISKTTEPVLCGALVSLMCQYGSSDDEENLTLYKNQSPVKINTTGKSNKQEQVNQNNVIITNIEKPSSTHDSVVNNTSDNDDDSGPEECKVVKNVEIEGNENIPIEIIRNAKKKQEKKVQKPVYQRRPKSKLPSTLLQKLLFKEMRHERNMVLQCVRYIVKNNYFDK